MDNKVAYNVLHNKFSNYIGRNMKHGNEVVCDLKEYKDPMTNYKENNMTKELPI